MGLDKIKRQAQTFCPSCGNTQLEVLAGIDEASELFKCPSCSYEFTKDELINGNLENIAVNVKEMGQQALPEIAKMFQKQLKEAFKNSKNIKFK